MLKARLYYDNGSIIIRDIAHTPFSTFDPRIKTLRAQALHYKDILEYLKGSDIEHEDNVLDLLPSPHIRAEKIALRDYQKKALNAWIRAGMRGCIVLPTGAGKTIVGIKAIEKVNSSSLIVVPTLDLMDQWVSVLSKHLNIPIGRLGGGEDQFEAVTVSTYDSAYIHASSLGNKFSLVIFDEVHHLASLGYRSIAEQLACTFRLGLTATIEREDGLHKDLPRLVGGVVYQAAPSDLAEEKHLANYTIERRNIEMLPEEILEYKKNYSMFLFSIRKLGFRMNYPNAFQKLIMMSSRSKLARDAILARNKAMNIALNSKAKFDELREILAENKGVKTLIFTQHNSLVYDISKHFLVPFITHKSKKEERHDILKGFKEGRYSAIVTSKVLDEGVDVPDAELGVIVSGTGSSREFIQRLGRLLRPKADERTARLIEIVSMETREMGTSRKRKKALERMDKQTGR
ncbi:MAG: DEAD/DEAH box helicase family protein [Nitrososphaerales archaeon]